MSRAIAAAAVVAVLSAPVAGLADPSPDAVEQLRQPVVNADGRATTSAASARA